MGNLILQMGVSLDGLVARPGRYGAGGWGTPPEDPALKQRKLDLIREAEAHLMGRNTYEEMAEFWPGSDDEYAEPMNSIPKVVFPPPWSVLPGPRRESRAEAAEILGVTKRTALTYTKRDDFPAPLARLASGPVWDATDIETWGAKTWSVSPWSSLEALELTTHLSCGSLRPQIRERTT